MMMNTHTAMAALQKVTGNEVPFLINGIDTNAWMTDLSAAVNYLITHDFHKLVAVLYRLDVSEKKLKQVLQDRSGSNAGEIIAQLIVERQLQKIKTRRNPQSPFQGG